LKWLVYCLFMLAGYWGVSAWEERRWLQLHQWTVAARNAGMQARRRDAWVGPYFAPSWLQRTFSRSLIDVTVRQPEQLATLKKMTDDGLPLLHIIFEYDPSADEIRRLHGEFPGVRLLEMAPGKTWLTDVVR
jgi:hypothetical protein